ncbi:hypothetical protein [Azospirillum argentinense]
METAFDTGVSLLTASINLHCNVTYCRILRYLTHSCIVNH